MKTITRYYCERCHSSFPTALHVGPCMYCGEEICDDCSGKYWACDECSKGRSEIAMARKQTLTHGIFKYTSKPTGS